MSEITLISDKKYQVKPLVEAALEPRIGVAGSRPSGRRSINYENLRKNIRSRHRISLLSMNRINSKKP